MRNLKIFLYAPLAITRLVFFFFHSGFMLYRLKLMVRFKENQQEYAFQILQKWSRTTLYLMGIRIQWEKYGELPDKSILMANHRSYIDPLIAFSVYPAVVIAKKELGSWPVIGTGLKLLNCLLVDRQNIGSMIETMRKTEIAVNKIGRLVVFPEGTTFAGPLTKSFKAGTFKVAANNLFPIIPMAIEFEDPCLAWIGNEFFVLHFLTKMGKPVNRVKVHIGKPLVGKNEKELSENTRKWIDEQLVEMRFNWNKPKNH